MSDKEEAVSSHTDPKGSVAEVSNVKTEIGEGAEGEETGEAHSEEGSQSSLEEGKKSLVESLMSIVVESPPPIEEVFDPDRFPPSYKDNSEKEQKAIKYCKTFLYQYTFLCNRRSPVFLKPKNEFGVEKLVCTTIKPHQLPFQDLLDWQDIADFVAGYLNYDKLKPPHLLPETLYAPQTVLERLHGNCFEYSTLLCSMLIGAGYDAFVVSGYATREVCNLDLSYTRCPFVEEDLTVYTRPIELQIKKYTVRPPKSFKSEYELRMAKKEETSKREAMEEQKALEDKARELEEAPPEDPIRGYRIHSWVMVLAGRRDIDTTFFIEPTTGVSHPTNWNQYLGIETVWNHLNYYINMMQEKIKGTDNLSYDIGDSRKWEYIFPGQDLHPVPWKEPKEVHKKIIPQVDACLEELHFDLPLSWTLPLNISRDDHERQFPTGKRTRRYKYTIVDDFCRYLNPDGLVRKIFVFSDLDCTVLAYTREIFADRADKLQSRFLHQVTMKAIEKFAYGRDDHLREHHYFAHSMGPENKRMTLFEPGKRVDELYMRDEAKEFCKGYFRNRPDRKYYKEARFGPDGKVMEKYVTPDSRPIEMIIECFTRNPEVPANADIAKVTYDVVTDEIDIEYHFEDNKITGSTRHFSKPPMWWDETQVLKWSPDLHWNYEADSYVKPKTELQLYQMLKKLMHDEKKTKELTRTVEREVKNTLKIRAQEEEASKLVKTYGQADKDEALRAVRLQEKAQARAEKLMKKSDALKDYLEPYLHRIGITQLTSKKQAQRVKDDCMSDLKDRLVNQANMIRDHFDKERSILDYTQRWYHNNFTTLTQQDIQDFRAFMIQHMFTAHILEQRLAHLKEYAPIKYHDLYDTMMKDPRLEPYLI